MERAQHLGWRYCRAMCTKMQTHKAIPAECSEKLLMIFLAVVDIFQRECSEQGETCCP